MLDKVAMRRRAVEEFARLGVRLQSVEVPIGASWPVPFAVLADFGSRAASLHRAPLAVPGAGLIDIQQATVRSRADPDSADEWTTEQVHRVPGQHRQHL
jgi:hypothetical protein